MINFVYCLVSGPRRFISSQLTLPAGIASSRTSRPCGQASQGSLVQSGLSRLAILPGTLLLGQLLGSCRAGMRVERSEFGVHAALLDGLDLELLLALRKCEYSIASQGGQVGIKGVPRSSSAGPCPC